MWNKTITVVLILLLSISFCIAQTSNNNYTRTCKIINDDYYVQEPVYNTTVINWPNSTKETIKTVIGYTDVLVRRNKEVCNETVNINGKDTDFRLQGYNCKNTTGNPALNGGRGEVICDSCIDGNCDGICSSNGGESCCKVTSGVVQCKNSAITWNETTKPLPVATLGVR